MNNDAATMFKIFMSKAAASPAKYEKAVRLVMKANAIMTNERPSGEMSYSGPVRCEIIRRDRYHFTVVYNGVKRSWLYSDVVCGRVIPVK